MYEDGMDPACLDTAEIGEDGEVYDSEGERCCMHDLAVHEGAGGACSVTGCWCEEFTRGPLRLLCPDTLPVGARVWVSEGTGVNLPLTAERRVSRKTRLMSEDGLCARIEFTDGGPSLIVKTTGDVWAVGMDVAHVPVGKPDYCFESEDV